MLYVAQLENDKFYVGFSARQYNERLLQHLQNKGSQWTKLHKVIDFIYVNPNGQQKDENTLTLQVMNEFGWYNVRGGSWCKIDLKFPPKELSTRKNLHTFKPHFSSTKQPTSRTRRVIDCCPSKARSTLSNKPSGSAKNNLGCDRCGRNSHFAYDCYAKKDIDGNNCDAARSASLSSKASSASLEDDICYRCGRDSHFADDCYAKKNIDGKWLGDRNSCRKRQ